MALTCPHQIAGSEELLRTARILDTIHKLTAEPVSNLWKIHRKHPTGLQTIRLALWEERRVQETTRPPLWPYVPKHWHEYHEQLVQHQRDLQNKKLKELTAAREPVLTYLRTHLPDQTGITLLTSYEQYQLEARTLRHCVDSYWGKVGSQILSCTYEGARDCRGLKHRYVTTTTWSQELCYRPHVQAVGTHIPTANQTRLGTDKGYSVKQARWRNEVVKVLEQQPPGLNKIWEDVQMTVVQFADGHYAIVLTRDLKPVAPLGTISLAADEIGRLSAAKTCGQLSVPE